MRNLRIIHDNAADRATLSVVPTPVAGLDATNLTSDDKFKVCRIATENMNINARWTVAETIAAVALPFTNLSPTATIRVKSTTEGSTVNYADFSELFTNAAWVKTDATIDATAAAAASVTAPSGGTAYKLEEAATTTEHFISQSWTVPINQQITVSFFVKAAERSFAVLKFDATANTAAPVAAQASYGLSTGTISNTTTNGWTFNPAVNIGNGWWRISATRTTTAAGNIVARLQTATSSTTLSYLGVLDSGIYVWGAQFEYGTRSSYYPTTGTTNATRPSGYIDSWQTYSTDNGAGVLACPASATKLKGWTPAAAASAYGYGGGACARYWFPAPVTATGIRIDIEDLNNLQGYIEVSRLVIGDYWEPEQGVEQGATITNVDTSKHFRTEAGSLITDVGTRHKKQSLPMPWINSADREVLWSILTGSGMSTPMFLSVHPNSSDFNLERMHQMYGKLVTTPIMSTPYWDANSATLEFEEV